MDLVLIVGNIALVCTVASHFTGLPICWDIIKKRSTAKVSVLPFLASFVCSSLWLFYSIFTGDGTLRMVNTIAVFLQLSYVSCFYANTSYKKSTFQKIFTASALLFIAYSYSFHIIKADKGETVLGYLASMGSILASAAPLASISDVMKTQSSESLPLPIILSTFIVQTLWCIYGILIQDKFIQLYKKGDLVRLAGECENLDVFAKLLKVSDKRNLLHNAFQALMDAGCPIALELAIRFQNYRLHNLHLEEMKKIQLGFSLGSFLTDAGWYPESEVVYLTCLELSRRNTQTIGWSVIFECLKRLLKVRTLYCKFKEAESTFQEALHCKELAERLGLKINFAGLYSEFSAFYFMQSRSQEAYDWGEEAIKYLDSSLPTREIINILCNASKACLMKKYFSRAEFLIKQALVKARKCYDRRTLIMADVLMDYGYFLLHMDSTHHSITVYQEVLNILTSILGGQNLRVAAVHEDIAYACYVNEYKTGNFKDAKEHIEKASSIKESLLSEDHFLLPSAKRITALIFEEIANDSHDYGTQQRLFQRAEELHLSALLVTKRHLGEMNVLTAKHYGNLGRLYQSMKKYGDAEEMLLKAITIKSTLLGSSDYQVAISVSHLASLYNYDMQRHKEAETLHLQAIDIGITHFGKSYSGLEFEYRGLLRIYANFGDADNVARMYSNLHEWKTLRHQFIEKESKTNPLDFKFPIVTPEKIYPLFITAT